MIAAKWVTGKLFQFDQLSVVMLKATFTAPGKGRTLTDFQPA